MKKVALILLCAALALFVGLAAADTSSLLTADISGSNAATTVFYVNATRSGSFLTLDGALGQGNVYHGSSYSRTGLYDEWLYGFYDVTVTGPAGTQDYKWVASADEAQAPYHTDWVASSTLTVPFYGTGVYTVTVRSVVASDYLYDAYVRTWRVNPTWSLGSSYGCTCSYSYPLVTATPTARVTATPSGTASAIRLNSSYAQAGGTVTGTITRYTTGVSHSIEWVHQNGASTTQTMGTAYGSFIFTIPSGWSTGYVYATLVTRLGSRELGRSTATLYITGSAATATPTAAPAGEPSLLTLAAETLSPGDTLYYTVTRYTRGVTHTVDFYHQNGSSFSQSLGTSTGTFNTVIPAGWSSGTVTVVLTTRLNGVSVGTSVAELTLISGTSYAASELTLYNTQAVPGQTVGGYVTVYASGVTHSILWKHSNGSAKSTSWGTQSGSLSFTVPSNWPSGKVTVTLTTHRGTTVLGTSVCTFTIKSSSPTVKPTAKPTATPNASLQKLKDGMIYPSKGWRQDGTNGLVSMGSSMMKRLTDFDRSSWASYVMNTSQEGDKIPEYAFDFDDATVGAVWIRVGQAGSGYGTTARPYALSVYVDCDQGRQLIEKKLSTKVNAGVQGFEEIDLGQTLTGVTRIEIFIRDIRTGSKQKYKVITTDFCFTAFR